VGSIQASREQIEAMFAGASSFNANAGVYIDSAGATVQYAEGLRDVLTVVSAGGGGAVAGGRVVFTLGQVAYREGAKRFTVEAAKVSAQLVGGALVSSALTASADRLNLPEEVRAAAGAGLGAFQLSKASKIVMSAAGSAPQPYFGWLGGKRLPFPGIMTRMRTFTVRPESTYRPLRDEFDADLVDGPKQTFLRDLGNRAANDADIRQKLLNAGLTERQILALSDGERPFGFHVHHKIPLKLGGDNSQSNLMLLQNYERGVNFHAPVTTAGNRLQSLHTNDNETFEAEWPDFDDFVYPS
jgi:hypothetical protein